MQADESAWSLAFPDLPDLPLYNVKLKLSDLQMRAKFEALLDGDGALDSADGRFQERTVDLEFLYNHGNYASVAASYPLFVSYLSYALRRGAKKRAIFLQHDGAVKHGPGEIPRRMEVVWTKLSFPETAIGGETERIKLSGTAPRALWEDRAELWYPEPERWASVQDGDVVEVAVELPDGRPFPTHIIYPILELRSDYALKSCELQNISENEGRGERLELKLAAYFPQTLVRIDPWTRAGGGIENDGVDVTAIALGRNNGFLHLFAGRNRWKIACTHPLELRVRYRRRFAR
jgi:hypothetical protein